MNYELAFYLLLAFLAGRWLPRRIYIGHDEEKYNKADWGILWSTKGKP